MSHAWDAWWFLSRRRQVAGAPTPIELTDIRAYLDEWLYHEPAERQFMIKLIDTMDDVFLAHLRGKLKQDGDTSVPN